MPDKAMVRIDAVSKSFGGIRALNNVSFDLDAGKIIGLIGPNGAGKTTLVNVMTGVYQPDSGRIFYQGDNVTKQKPFQAARRGLCRTFQIVQPFPEMTVLENVAAGALFAGGASDRKAAGDAAMGHLEFVGLADIASLRAASLSLANRKRLELAKSLAMEPRVLLLDEVNAGLNASEIDAALDLIRKISDRGVTIMIIEHLMKVVLNLCGKIFVLHQGALISQGTPDQVIEDEAVIEAYLGSKFAERQRRYAANG